MIVPNALKLDDVLVPSSTNILELMLPPKRSRILMIRETCSRFGTYVAGVGVVVVIVVVLVVVGNTMLLVVDMRLLEVVVLWQS